MYGSNRSVIGRACLTSSHACLGLVAARPQDAVEQVRRPFQAGSAEEERFAVGAVQGVAHGVERRVRQVDVRVLERNAHVVDPRGVDRFVVGPPDVAGVAGHVDEASRCRARGSTAKRAGFRIWPVIHTGVPRTWPHVQMTGSGIARAS